MSSTPRDPAFDSTLDLLKDGHAYLWKRHQRFDSDIFVTRLGGRTTVSIHGPEAARVFYDDTKFQRHGALPRRIVTSLFGKKAIHTLDDAAHRPRKQVFMSLMGPSTAAVCSSTCFPSRSVSCAMTWSAERASRGPRALDQRACAGRVR